MLHSFKITILALLTFSIAPVIHFVDIYIFSDWEFLKFLLCLIGIDTGLGMFNAWKKFSLSSDLFSRLFGKLILYLVFLVLTHVLVHFTVEGNKNELFSWFSSFAYSGIMVREGLSIVENITKINPNILPAWIMDRLKIYDKTGPEPINQPKP